MDKAELKQSYIRYHKTADGKLRGVSLEFVNEIGMDSFLDKYAQQVKGEKCESCVFSYHDKAKGHHGVEDFYGKGNPMQYE